jgi:hypothetical protein
MADNSSTIHNTRHTIQEMAFKSAVSIIFIPVLIAHKSNQHTVSKHTHKAFI